MILLKRSCTIITLSAFLMFFSYTLNSIADETDAVAADEDDIYEVVEKMPSFPGGENALVEYLKSELKYPEKERAEGVEAIVLVRFIVRKDGSVTDVEVLQNHSAGITAEAERVISNMPKWEPGLQRGEAVNIRLHIPIRFSLADKPVPVDEDGN